MKTKRDDGRWQDEGGPWASARSTAVTPSAPGRLCALGGGVFGVVGATVLRAFPPHREAGANWGPKLDLDCVFCSWEASQMRILWPEL